MQAELPAGYVHDPALVILLNLFILSPIYPAPLRHAVRAFLPGVSLDAFNRWLTVIERDGLIVSSYIDAEKRCSVSLTDSGKQIIENMILRVIDAESVL
jgi:hypothetical protein